MKTREFLRHNSIFFIGSLAVAVLNYLYYPVVGRLLSTAAFGEVQALVSIFMQATIFLTVVANVAVNVVANESDVDRRNSTVLELERLSILITTAVLLLALLFVGRIRDFLQFHDVSPFFLLALSLLAGVPLALRSAYLRGRTAFGRVSLVNILSALVKLLASVAFVLLGLRAAGAIGGLVVGQLVGLFYAQWAARQLGLTGRLHHLRRPNLALLRPQLPYAGLVLVVSLVTTVLFSIDVVVAKHYFSADMAGAYAGISTIARIIFFLTASIGAVLLSSVKVEAPPAVNRTLLWRSIALQTVLGGGTLLVFALVPRLVIRLLIGSRYLTYADLLPPLSLALFLLALASLLFNYDLALRRRSAAVIAVLGAGATFGLLALHHATPRAVVESLLWGSILLLILRILEAGRGYLMKTDDLSTPKPPINLAE